MVGSIGNNMDVKKANRNNIFRHLYQSRDMVSKLDIVNSLGISLPTVNQHLKYLRENNYVLDNGTFDSTGGRKPIAITYNPDIRYSVGLDVTKDHVIIVLIDLSGRIRVNRQVRIQFSQDDNYFAAIGEIVWELVAKSGVDTKRILGVGIALPAIVTEDRHSIHFGAISDIHFEDGGIERFQSYIPYPCFFCNDANAGGIAEMWNIPDSKNAFYISLNNTVGGSVIYNNRIYYGENRRSGEIGHVTLVEGGRPCYCGKKGCVDAYCSALVLSNCVGGDLDKFFECVNNGSEYHVDIWDQYLYHLSHVINNLRMLFDCNIIIGGYVGAYFDDFYELIKSMASSLDTYSSAGEYLSICRYKLHATAVGAALQFISEFIKGV